MTRRSAIVTGASSDLGAAIAGRLLDDGVGVVLTGRDPDRLAAKAGRHLASPACMRVAADLTTPDGVAKVAAAAHGVGGLDLLVLGSGVYQRSTDPAVLASQFAANVTGPYALLQAVLPQLKAAQGQVVFLNSTQGLRAAPGIGQYAATQHALRALADSLREEVNDLGVRVLTLYLGRVATERQRAIFALEGRAYTPERLIQPDDVARLVLATIGLPRTVEVTEITLRPMMKPLIEPPPAAPDTSERR